VSGRLDAFQWQMPLAALPSDKNATIESSPFEEAMLAAAPRRVEPPQEVVQESPVEVPPLAAQDNAPVISTPKPTIELAPVVAPISVAPAPTPPPTEAVPAAAPPLFRARQDIPKAPPGSIPAVSPILRAPDEPGIDDEAVSDEFADQINPPPGQAGGWRGFLSRWGN
jgi:HemY protein